MHSEATELTTLSPSTASRERMRKLLSGLLTSSEAAKALNMSQSSIRGLLNAGELKPLGTVGQILVFWADDVEALKAKRAEWRKGKQNEHRV